MIKGTALGLFCDPLNDERDTYYDDDDEKNNDFLLFCLVSHFRAISHLDYFCLNAKHCMVHTTLI